MHTVIGGCHCGNALVELKLTQAPHAYRPRACDCGFCRKHCAAYLSDAAGSLSILIKDAGAAANYRHGSGKGEFLLCRNCGVFVAALYRGDHGTYGSVNVRIIDGGIRFGEELPVSPKKLSGIEKTARWQAIWFANVDIHSGSAVSGAKT
jgi:hypothetical protein